MTDKDRLYYQQRAERELELAAEAQDAVVCQAHYDLATHYLERAHGTALAVPADPERLRARG
jgi:hypothetical protein